MENKLTEGVLQVDDLESRAEPFLTEKAKIALAIKHHSLCKFKNGVVTHSCVYLGRKTPISKIDDAIQAVAKKVNDLAERDLIDSALSHFIKLDLSPETTGYFNEDGSVKEREAVVLCYVLVSEETHNDIMNEIKSNSLRLETT